MQQVNSRGNIPVSEEDIIRKTTENVIQYIKEEEDKTRRKPNLVIYNIPESDKENQKEREDEDVAICCDTFENSLGLEKEEYNITKVVRLGKPNSGSRNRSRPRPLLVIMSAEREKWTVIKNAKKLKHETNPVKRRLRIVPDMTVKEREIQK